MPVDYLAVGHLTRDLKNNGFTLGGSVAYSGLTAKALGREVGIVTSFDDSLDTSPLANLHIFRLPSEVTTTFENSYEHGVRNQILHAKSTDIGPAAIPMEWRSVKLVHLGPIANEVNPQLVHHFGDSFIGLTPQGWMRKWDEDGNVYYADWEPILDTLSRADAVVVSIEDLQGDETIVADMAKHCRILAVTRGPRGASVYLKEESVSISAQEVSEVDSTGSGDIFAAAFFVHLQELVDPFEAGHLATAIASKSVSTPGLESVPNTSDILKIRDNIQR